MQFITVGSGADGEAHYSAAKRGTIQVMCLVLRFTSRTPRPVVIQKVR